MKYLQVLYSFKGKLARLDFFLATLVSVLMVPIIFLPIILMLDSITATTHAGPLLKGMVLSLALINTLYINLAICAKRLRDLNWSLWLMPLLFIPVIGFILKLLCFFVPGKSAKMVA